LIQWIYNFLLPAIDKESMMVQSVSFGYWIRRQRKALDLTQSALANRVGCSRITITKIERDERRPSRIMAERLADALCIPNAEHPLFIEVALAERSPEGLALPATFDSSSPPQSIPGFIYNLPVPVTSLVGRKREIAEVSRLLKRKPVRLLTLLGPGGVGKTRLAITVASRLGRLFKNGVAFVPLSAIGDPELILTKIAETLHVPETQGRSLMDSLLDHLQNYQMLLLVDNFEHVLAAATLISKLLESVPNLKVLITSRAALHLSGEYEYPVPPLQLPEVVFQPGERSPLRTELVSTLKRNESFQLFVQRASAKRLDFEADSKTAPYVAEICRRLDGLPLAIELAAAKIKTESPKTLLNRLEDRFETLTGGPRDLPVRLQTLRNTFEWSYELLAEREKCTFNRLGVFAGGCSQQAAEAVCCIQPLDRSELNDVLSSLVDQSMLQRTDDAGQELRYEMLSVLQEYALEQLVERNEEDGMRRKHLEFFTRLAEAAEPHLWDEEQEIWGKRLVTELDNLRTALSWSLERSSARKDEIELGSRLAGALWYFWYGRGYLHEGRRWLRYAVNRVTWPSKARAKAVTAASVLAWQQGENQQARLLADEAIQLWRQFEDLEGLGEILHMMGHIVFDQQDYQAAQHLFQESLEVYEEAGEKAMQACLISDLGMLAYHQGDFKKARQLYEQSLTMFGELGSKDGIASTYLRLGDLERLAGEYERAFEFYQRAREIFEELELKLEIASAHHKLGYIYQQRCEFWQARKMFIRALELQAEMGNKQGIIECLAGLAGLAATNRQPDLAAQLFGAAQALKQATGLPLAPADQAAWGQYENQARQQLAPAEFDRYWQQGFFMPNSQAVTIALGLQIDGKD
jgi:predicted ATPase/transcriptional regulator with XRE-family HTH domain/Tfp pilus assembly protein PilF